MCSLPLVSAHGRLASWLLFTWAMGTNVAPLSEFSCMHWNAIFNLGFAIFHRGREKGSEAQINVGNVIAVVLTVVGRWMGSPANRDAFGIDISTSGDHSSLCGLCVIVLTSLSRFLRESLSLWVKTKRHYLIFSNLLREEPRF